MLNTETLAAQYIRGKGCRPTSDEYQTFCNWVSLRFQRIRDRVDFTPDEVSPEEMLAYWEEKARLLISTHSNIHPHWLPVINAQFRAIHDHDHIMSGCGFDMAGEACTAGYAMSTAPESIGWILWSEIALQAAATIRTGSFQRQKLVRS